MPEDLVAEIATPVGTARVYVRPAAVPVATLVLGTGAGGSVEAVDLSLMPRQLPPRGVSVVRVEQPWHVAGQKMVARPPVLDAGWAAVVDALRTDPRFTALDVARLPLAVGGRSNGARVACRTATEVRADGVVCFAFPLHPPGRSDQTRLPELLQAAALPVLLLQGERDAFGTAAQLAAELVDADRPADRVQVQPVPAADHSMRTARASGVTGTDVAELLIGRTLTFVGSLVTSPGPGAPGEAWSPSE